MVERVTVFCYSYCGIMEIKKYNYGGFQQLKSIYKNILTPSHATQGGTRYYSQEQRNHFFGLNQKNR